MIEIHLFWLILIVLAAMWLGGTVEYVACGLLINGKQYTDFE